MPSTQQQGSWSHRCDDEGLRLGWDLYLNLILVLWSGSSACICHHTWPHPGGCVLGTDNVWQM